MWVTSWPFAEYVKHEWAGAWVNSLFRNESRILSSELIREGVAATRAFYGDPPDLGIVTFVDSSKIRSTNPGYCYLMAGWKRIGKTKGGLDALGQSPSEMPDPIAPKGFTPSLLPGKIPTLLPQHP
uniref:Uncharacterized protein n=1 Tax=viral metagenome TaxID=1070528 RepID=A0A6H1ZXU9_9ZZZZ